MRCATRSGRVLLGVRRRGGMASIEVWDSGPGIEAEQLQRIFDEFHRLEQPSPWGERGWPGTGHLRAHGAHPRPSAHGAFLARSRQRVRRARAIVARVLRGAPRAVATAPLGALGRPLHVLCLDNEPAILDGMSALLTRWGITCDLAPTPEEALAAPAGGART